MPREARREQLLDAAMAVISRDGYAGVSIDAIAREAGVTRPVVYGAFDDLAQLLGALLDRQEARALSALLEALPPDLGASDPDAFLVGAVRRMIETVTSDPETWRPILAPAEGTPAAVRERIARDRDVFRARIEALLRMGVALRGGPQIDAEMASHALIAVAEYFGRMLLEDPARFDADRLVALAESTLSLLPRSDASPR
ncbi:MAG TPA: helix-turn-helix domain-containing protein [Solirubrobacteraceae bacterium]